MIRVDIRKREISREICRYCYSYHEVWFDEKHDEYLCSSCLIKESEKIAIEDDEDALNEQVRLRNL